MKKILVIQFKYFGDAVFLAPALLAIKDKFPNADIHLLVAKEIAPVFNNLKYIKKFGLSLAREVNLIFLNYFLLLER